MTEAARAVGGSAAAAARTAGAGSAPASQSEPSGATTPAATDVALSVLLEREHRQIDSGIEEYRRNLDSGSGDTTALHTAMEALRRHIYLEERFVFPTLREAGLVAPLFVMLREHGELWDSMAALDAMLDDGADDAALNAKCAVLLEQLDRHNSKEEPIIYPQADAKIPDYAAKDLRRFIEAGHMPDGWTCERASV